MSQTAQAPTRPAADVIRQTAVSQAANGVCFAVLGEAPISSAELERLVNAVPQPIATALRRKAYYFVPLTVNSGDDTLIAERYDVALSDQAVCHRNFTVGDSQCVFISTRLMDEKFSIAFEFYINVAHAFVEVAGVSEQFGDLAWKQAQDRVRGLRRAIIPRSISARRWSAVISTLPGCGSAWKMPSTRTCFK